ncbi:MAG: MMPL family transporter [Nocardioidaceae bacterium]
MIGFILGLGFLLVLLALQAPLIALVGTLVSPLSTAAAFGVAKLMFQNGANVELHGFESQGFLDAWAPVFFFAMIFAIAMDYAVFLLASPRHWEYSEDAQGGMVGPVMHSGRVIFAVGAVMVRSSPSPCQDCCRPRRWGRPGCGRPLPGTSPKPPTGATT